MTNYYDVPALSASGINLYYKSPLHYWVESPFNNERVISPPTHAMLMGNVCHKMVLERDSFSDEYVVEPKLDKRTKNGKSQYEEWVQQHSNKTVITQDMYDHAMMLSDAMWRNESVRRLIDNGQPEKPMSWKYNTLPCKAKIDYYRKGLILDYKTTVSASLDDFRSSLVRYGYHRQAAWYMEAIYATTGEYAKGFVFIAQEKELPDAIGIYAIDAESLAVGKHECMRAADDIKRRLMTGEWIAYSQLPQEISIPHWYQAKQPPENHQYF